MNVRFQKTAKGEVAILPRTEYEALVAKAAEADEDAGTARIVARGRGEVADGGLRVPLDVANRIADGTHPVRALREWRKMTQVELSARTNLSQGFVSDIESGRRVGTPATLLAISGALKVPLELLIA